jgi:hypothetical protein
MQPSMQSLHHASRIGPAVDGANSREFSIELGNAKREANPNRVHSDRKFGFRANWTFHSVGGVPSGLRPSKQPSCRAECPAYNQALPPAPSLEVTSSSNTLSHPRLFCLGRQFGLRLSLESRCTGRGTDMIGWTPTVACDPVWGIIPLRPARRIGTFYAR